MNAKLFKPATRKLSDLSTELLRYSRPDLALEVQGMIVRLFEIQDQLTPKDSKLSNEEVQP